MRFTTRRIDAPDLAERLRASVGHVMLYAHGDRMILHEGAVAVVEASGADRCLQLREHTTAIHWDHDSDAPAVIGPVWLGGLAFHRDHAPVGPWAGFPPAAFWLPKRQTWWEGDAAYETTCDAPALPDPPRATGTIASTGPGQWHETVDDACAQIMNGSFTKVVLARAAPAERVDIDEIIPRLFGMEDGIGFLVRRGATFYGRTPERLVRLSDGDVSTHALAGTAPMDDDGDQERALRASGKDVLEHELVVAFVRERLVEAGVADVHQTPRRVRALRHVQHLETPIHGTAGAQTHILDLAGSLHPTPAVCGTPRQRSLQFILEREGFPRGWYAGTVGWFNERGEGELAVALRCALQTDDARYLFAGAGIVAGSEPEAEWQETENKLAGLREAG